MKHPLEQFKYCPKCGSTHFVVHNFKSKKCEECKFVYYFNPSAATVAVIINKEQEILVCKRAKDPAKGSLDLPGGFIDMAETGEEGVAREVKEETGLEVEQIEYLFSIPNIYLYSGFQVETLDIFYLCRVSSYTSLTALDDVEATKFIPLKDLEVDRFGLTSIKKGVQRILKNKDRLFVKQDK